MSVLLYAPAAVCVVAAAVLAVVGDGLLFSIVALLALAGAFVVQVRVARQRARERHGWEGHGRG